MRWKPSDFVAGLFVLAGLVLIMAMFIVVRGQLSRQDNYYSYFDNVAGLKSGAAVIYEGYIIGSVDAITPENTDEGMRFRIDIGIEEGWAVPSDSTSQIAALSLLSAPAIQITAGTAEPMAPNSQITAVESGNIMADLSRTADRLTYIAETSLAPLLDTTANLLENEGRSALASVAGLTTKLDEEAPEILDGIKQTVANLETASGNLGEITGSGTLNQVNGALASLQEAADNIVRLTETANDEANEILASTQAIIAKGDGIMDQSSALVADAQSFVGTDNQRLATEFLERLNNAAGSLEQSMATLETLASAENVGRIETLIVNVQAIRAELLGASQAIRVASENAAQLSDLGEDRIESFLQRLESSALNIEEMTAQLRDDPSILIRGTK